MFVPSPTIIGRRQRRGGRERKERENTDFNSTGSASPKRSLQKRVFRAKLGGKKKERGRMEKSGGSQYEVSLRNIGKAVRPTVLGGKVCLKRCRAMNRREGE